nr:hypothetical protein [Salinisphaera shabanensis]
MFELDPASLDLGKIEDVVDQILQRRARALHLQCELAQIVVRRVALDQMG